LATIRIAAKEGNKAPKNCESDSPPKRIGNFYEFEHASEEELAFWNALSKDEREELEDMAYKKCLHEVLHDYMKEESKKGEKMQEEEKNAIGGQTPPPRVPDNPPLAPPSGGPPIQS
jgi:hypothetical protein